MLSTEKGPSNKAHVDFVTFLPFLIEKKNPCYSIWQIITWILLLLFFKVLYSNPTEFDIISSKSQIFCLSLSHQFTLIIYKLYNLYKL